MPTYAEQGLTLPAPRDSERDDTAAAIPTERTHYVALPGEPVNVSRGATAATLQGYIASAETGYTRDLVAFYRDSLLGHAHIQAEFN
jgi:hypothetical protein